MKMPLVTNPDAYPHSVISNECVQSRLLQSMLSLKSQLAVNYIVGNPCPFENEISGGGHPRNVFHFFAGGTQNWRLTERVPGEQFLQHLVRMIKGTTSKFSQLVSFGPSFSF